MAIKFLPTKVLAKMAPEKTIKKLVTKDLTLNRAAIKTLENSGVLTKKGIEDTAIQVIKNYKQRYKEEIKDGATKTEALDEALNSKKQMIQRVQNDSIFQITRKIKGEYRGEFYTWLPSDADEPDPLHQLNYGSMFQIGKGEMPGDRYGCRCGMNILVDETLLELGE